MSSVQRGFGLGCGLIVGILCALILIPVAIIGGCSMMVGGCALLMIPAANEAQQAAQRAAEQEQAPVATPAATPEASATSAPIKSPEVVQPTMPTAPDRPKTKADPVMEKPPMAEKAPTVASERAESPEQPAEEVLPDKRQEQRAATALSAAKRQSGDARRKWLQKVVDQFPKTQAAKEAARLLEDSEE